MSGATVGAGHSHVLCYATFRAASGASAEPATVVGRTRLALRQAANSSGSFLRRGSRLLLPLHEQVDYDDYCEVNGVQLPFHVRTTSGAPYDLVTRTLLQIRHNVPVDEALLRAPSPR